MWACLDLMAYGKMTEYTIMQTLYKAELKYYEEAIPELSDLLYLLRTGSCFYRDKDIKLGSEERKSCREIEGIEHLNIASLLIESYSDMELKCFTLMTEYNLKKPTDVVFAWDKLCQAYSNAVYGILLRADFHLATQWRKGNITWQDLADEIDKKRLTL